MSITLEATPCHQDANSYIQLSEAEKYFDERTKTKEWADAGEEKKKEVLIMATNIIDSYRFFHSKMEDDQILKHPRSNIKTATGQADSGSTTTVVDDTFANKDNYSDYDWERGAIKITEGTNKNEIRQITGFDVSTGTFTTDAFSSAIDSTSQFKVIEEIPKTIKDVCCEVAIWLLDKGIEQLRRDTAVKSISAGKISKTYKSQELPMPALASVKLKHFIKRTGKIVQ